MSTTSVTVERSQARWLARIGDYVELSKPRIGFLVLIAVGSAYWVASWGEPEFLVLANVLIGTLLIASSASALNQWLERRRDALMERTANRPLPAARLSVRETILFASVTLTLGIACLYLTVGWATAAWALGTWLLYAWVYTPLKTHTALNTTVGAIAGAMPIMIGWTAAHTAYDLRAVTLYLILFLWQFPHFMAIAWMYRKQYSTAGMKMLSVVDPSGRRAGTHAVLAALALVPVSILPVVSVPGLNSALYALAALLLGLGQLGFAIAFSRHLNDLAARRLLRATLIYLPTLFLLLVLVPWG